MKLLICCFCVLLLTVGNFATQKKNIFEYTLCDWIRANNYECCVYEVVTEDNYIITVHRINGRKGKATKKLRHYPILFSHGLLTSGRDWTFSGKPFSIAFELADCDFDVWMISHRGTDLSDRSTVMTNRDSKFYDFSFHEMGKYDLPAVITFMRQATNSTKVIHASFSQGGASFFVMYAEKPEFVDENVQLAICMAPAAYICHSRNALAFSFVLIDYQNGFRMSMSKNHMNTVKPIQLEIYFLARACYAAILNNPDEVGYPCLLVFAILIDYNYKYTADNSVVPYVIACTLKDTSSKQIMHLIQGALTCTFAKYRTNPTDDLVEYNLNQNVSTKVVVVLSEHDNFVPFFNKDQLQKRVKNICVYYVNGYYHTNLVFDMGTHCNLRRKYFATIMYHSPYINEDDQRDCECEKKYGSIPYECDYGHY